MFLHHLKKSSLILETRLGAYFGTRLISSSDGDKRIGNLNKHENIKAALDQKQKLRKTFRTLTTLNHSVPLAARAAVSKDESREFMAVFPDIVRDITDKTKEYNGKDISNWFAKALQYNVPRGKKNRGLATIITYKKLVATNELTDQNLRLCHILGWCVELLQTMLLMCDDVMDGSQTRRGQPCWHTIEGVGLSGINDALMIENAIFWILKKYFSEKEYYTRLLELFHEIIFITIVGQAGDLKTSSNKVDSFSMEMYKTIAANKTSYYTFYLPVALAMNMAEFKHPEAFRQAKTILLEIGHFFQVQDDFLDCFGDPETTGKIGTDIQENKCSWLAVVAMQRANDSQKSVMLECYGSSDPEKVSKVKKLYKELGIPNTFAIYEEESYNLIKTQIQQTSKGVPHEVFFSILNSIYRRKS
ncbi:FDPS family protein [Megaselia abdita]